MNVSSHSSRALNEMWKCQNMLRGLVRELLDLHKLPTVSHADMFLYYSHVTDSLLELKG